MVFSTRDRKSRERELGLAVLRRRERIQDLFIAPRRQWNLTAGHFPDDEETSCGRPTAAKVVEWVERQLEKWAATCSSPSRMSSTGVINWEFYSNAAPGSLPFSLYL